MKKVVIILSVICLFAKCSYMEDVQLVNTYRQSELYIKGFKAQFDSLPESKKRW